MNFLSITKEESKHAHLYYAARRADTARPGLVVPGLVGEWKEMNLARGKEIVTQL
jgi:hypothetical protein